MRWRVNTGYHFSRWEWHRWWAWYPVKVDNQYVWLEYVYRKAVTVSYGTDYEYRLGG
jgi:hypothetical protein